MTLLDWSDPQETGKYQISRKLLRSQPLNHILFVSINGITMHKWCNVTLTLTPRSYFKPHPHHSSKIENDDLF